ncbi:MAG: pentapeptide repeat-containing protein [Candidatus Eremiobacterota bacterium]
MGVYLCYEAVSDRAAEVLKWCLARARALRWAGEGFDLEARGAHLGGSFKLSLDDWRDQLRETLQALRILAEASRRFEVTWKVESDGLKGTVTPAGPDAGLADFMASGQEELQRATGSEPWKPDARKRFSRKGAAELQTRWTPERERQLVSALGGNDPPPFPPTPAGRLDARGLRVEGLVALFGDPRGHAADPGFMPPGFRLPRVLRRVDFSYPVPCQIRHAIPCLDAGELELVDCHLDGLEVHRIQGPVRLHDCSLRGVRMDDLGGTLERCDLSMSTLRRWVPYGERELVDCDFSRASLKGIRASAAVYLRCRFDGADLGRAEFCACRFVECSFHGAAFGDTYYSRVSFERCPGLDRDRMLRAGRRDCHGHPPDQEDVLVFPG